jgi:pyruvate,water dikinase
METQWKNIIPFTIIFGILPSSCTQSNKEQTIADPINTQHSEITIPTTEKPISDRHQPIHKYYIVVALDLFRKRVLVEAERLYAEGRLEHPEDVFGLTIKDLDDGIKEPEAELRKIVSTNTQFLNKIQHIRNFPLVIDSRGLILRPPKKKAKEGEIAGEPISVGMVRGREKVLNAPDEKPVLPGEILVTRATDPGWTPLFISAAGVILEIGGSLQHGALVAREYGKPCVAGIENATQVFEDGQIVELDGANGVVKLL